MFNNYRILVSSLGTLNSVDQI